MRRTIFVMLLISLVCILLTGCNKTSNGSAVYVAPNVPTEYADFEIIESNEWEGWAVVYDRNTGVMYVILDGFQSTGMTPIYNADGTLKIYGKD